MAYNYLPVGIQGAPGVPRNVGASNPRAKLTEDDVRKIRKSFDGSNRKELAKKFGVSYQSIIHVLNHTTWAHVK